MNISNVDKVNNLLADIQFKSPDQFEMMIAIRDLFFKSNENLVEDIKYGGLVFNLSDNLIGGIYSYKEHLSIEFSDGASFTDNESLLEGGGKKRRHLKIISNDDILEKSAEYYINQASND